jgi:hypothetical protein
VRAVSLCGILSPGGHGVTPFPGFPGPVIPGYCRDVFCGLDDHHSGLAQQASDYRVYLGYLNG